MILRGPAIALGIAFPAAAALAAAGMPAGALLGATAAVAAAALSVSPGALSYAVVLAAQGHGDLRSVVVLQSVRLLLVTLCLPPIIVALAGVASPDPIAAGSAVALGPLPALAFVVAGLASGWLVDRAGSPAAYLLAGLAVSGLAHALGWVNGVLPSPVVFFGFVVTGAVIGSRFTGIARPDLVRLAAAGLAATAVSVALSAAGALCVANLTGLSFPVVWVAFAPGGVEGMAAISLALGYVPAFVATHHIFRIVAVIALLPLGLRVARR